MMTTDQGDNVQRLFEEALKRKPDQRAGFLDEAWGKPEKAAEWRVKMGEEGSEASRQQGTEEDESDE